MYFKYIKEKSDAPALRHLLWLMAANFVINVILPYNLLALFSDMNSLVIHTFPPRTEQSFKKEQVNDQLSSDMMYADFFQSRTNYKQ